MPDWRFYGRSAEFNDLSRIVERGRWFFLNMTGRRRIGKTALIKQILAAGAGRRTFYVQIPDSGDAGVLSAVADGLEIFGIPETEFARPRSLLDLAKLVESMARAGIVVVLDEFQYFNRKSLVEFPSFLQAAVDRIVEDAHRVTGGMVVLGSVHTEMAALLENRSAPLYNRTTGTIELRHLDISTVLEILKDHDGASPERLLFLWSLFEGVPKYYRDCYEEGVYRRDRRDLLRRMFFESSSPLRTEAENWFLRELRGRFDTVLKFVARHPGEMHGELLGAIENVNENRTQIASYLTALQDKFRLIERKMPVFAPPDARRGRYYLSDNFLQSWLGALSIPVGARDFRPVNDLVASADDRLATVEGFAFERLVGKLHEERSAKGLEGFPLTARITGYWDKSGTEIDLVAVNEDEKRIRFGSCKRSPGRLVADSNNLRLHANRFLDSFPKYRSWHTEFAGFSPRLDDGQRELLRRNEITPIDLDDLTRDLV